MKLMNNDDDINENNIIDYMDYLNDSTPTIETLRTEFYNDSSFSTLKKIR